MKPIHIQMNNDGRVVALWDHRPTDAEAAAAYRDYLNTGKDAGEFVSGIWNSCWLESQPLREQTAIECESPKELPKPQLNDATTVAVDVNSIRRFWDLDYGMGLNKKKADPEDKEPKATATIQVEVPIGPEDLLELMQELTGVLDRLSTFVKYLEALGVKISGVEERELGNVKSLFQDEKDED